MPLRADFYIVPYADFHACIPFATQLIKKIVASGQSVHVTTPSEAVAQQLEEALWADSPASFIPHHRDENALEVGPLHQPVTVQLQLTIDKQPCETFLPRLLQIVPEHPNLKALARDHYRHYKDEGYELHTHTIEG